MSVVPMSQRLELEIKDKQISEVKDLNLDGCTATEIEGITAEYTNLQKLSLVGVGLTTLKGFPALPQLTKLNLSENPIVDGLDSLTECPKLEVLNLSGNKLKAVADLSPLASLEHLTSLELNNCDIAAIEDYRKEVFSVLPKLKYLDGLDQSGGDEPVTEAAPEAVTKPIKEEGDDEEDDDEDDDEEEEEVGISALQGSKELEDDEEDYVPGAEDEDVDDLDDEDEEDEDEDEDDEEVDEDEVADLSGSGVEGPRRAVKRPISEAKESEDVPSAKCKATDEAGDHAVEPNGTKASAVEPNGTA